MANRKWEKLTTIGHDRKIVEGSFAPAGAGAPTGLKASGVVGMQRSDVGLFTIACDPHSELESAVATVQSVATLLHPQIQGGGILDDATFGHVYAQNIQLVNAAGAATDLAADPDNRVHFRFVFRNSRRV